MKRLILSTVCMLFCATGLWARTLVDRIYYDFDASTQTASVEEGVNKYSGDITIPSTVTYNGTSYNVTSIGRRAFSNCTGLTSINVAEDNLYYASIDGVLYSKDKKTLIECPQGKTGSVTIPNSVTSIEPEAFYKCTGLTSITIGNGVIGIGYRAFSNCTGLTSVTIGNGVTSIGENAFAGCTGLTSITIPNSVTSIEQGAFEGYTGLTSITVEATNPPLCYGYGLGMLNYNIPLYVPAGSVDAYKAAYEWKKFTNIQTIPATGVNEATVENTVEKSEVKKIIDRNGIIYIEKDGTRYFLNGSKVK